MRIRSIAVLLIAAAVLGFAAPAYAASVYYGSASAPVKAENNSDDGNAWFYGAVAVHQATWLRNRYWYRDSAPGGNAAYVKTDWTFYKPCGGGMCWLEDSGDRSSDTKSGDWILGEDFVDLDYNADRGRAYTRVCENQNNSPDPCSKNVVATLSY